MVEVLGDKARIAAVFRAALQTEIDEEEVHASLEPLKNYIDWLDEPDQLIDASGATVFFWSPIRLSPATRAFEIAVVDLGESRGVYTRSREPDGRSVLRPHLFSFQPIPPYFTP